MPSPQEDRPLERERFLREQAEAAVRSRDEILAIVSHDLRNPLGTIAMSIALLERDLDAERRGAQVKVVRRAIKRMERLIQDLLDVNQIESGRLSVATEPMDAARLLEEAKPSLELQAADKGITLQWDVAHSAVPVIGDHGRLTQVLANLFGNAMKFTPAGGRVTVSLGRDDQAATICVSDTGPGIAEADLAHLFDRFWQSKDRPRKGGVGLGLAIAQGIVKAHGGRIWVRSRLGEGSSFCFTVPLAPSASGQSAG